ncbi:MAG: sigma-70 family RNA polymerase sigma factor [Anaerolineae bacterium]|nr:sigma-70 family RNA polymerase sigma factor [Anaerolineae bacterium]
MPKSKKRRWKIQSDRVEIGGINLDELGNQFDQLFPKLFGYVAYRVGRKQDAEDIVGEAFLKAAGRLDSFEWRHNASFEAWVFKIAQNLIKNYYRRNGHDLLITVDEVPNIKEPSLSPDEIILQQEKFTYLRELINTLSTRQQEVITLKFFGGFRNQAIAELLDLDERTVSAYISRGLRALQEKYSEAYSRSDSRKSE